MYHSKELKLDVGDKKITSAEMYYIAEDIATEITPMNIDVFAVKTLKIECDTVTIPAAGVAAIEVTIE